MGAEERKLVIVAGVAWDETADPLWTKAEELLLSMPYARLHFVHVVGASALKAETSHESLVDDTLKRLHDWVHEKAHDDFIDPFGAQIHLEVAIGHPADELVQIAVDNEADLLLLGTHGRKGVAKLVLGSVAEEVLHKSPCSVFIARRDDFDGRAKTPPIAAPPEPGHKPYRPHPPRYHSSVAFNSFDPTRP